MIYISIRTKKTRSRDPPDWWAYWSFQRVDNEGHHWISTPLFPHLTMCIFSSKVFVMMHNKMVTIRISLDLWATQVDYSNLRRELWAPHAVGSRQVKTSWSLWLSSSRVRLGHSLGTDPRTCVIWASPASVKVTGFAGHGWCPLPACGETSPYLLRSKASSLLIVVY